MKKLLIFLGLRKAYRSMKSVRNYISFLISYFKFKNVNDGRFIVNWRQRYPCLSDKTENVGFDRHYIYHTAWATRRILESGVKRHVDISSSLYFVTQLSASIEVEHNDFREPNLTLPGLSLKTQNITELSFKSGSIESLSCMHVLEHIGLGRYGDALDVKGDLKAVSELTRVLANNGLLYLVVPVGENSKVFFNAHRSYKPELIVEAFKELSLEEFSLIKEKEGGIFENVPFTEVKGEDYACGLFIFKKEEL